MKLLKNRTVIGVLCILLSLIICFVVTPMFNQSVSQRANVVRVAAPISAGDQITSDMLQTVEVGGYNLPDGVYTSTEDIVGMYAVSDLVPGDFVFSGKLSDSPAAENEYLYNLNGERQAISVTIKSFSLGLSGKLKSGDIVSVIAPDFKGLGVTVVPDELQFIEVISVTAASGYDANTGDAVEGDERELPSTVTLLVLPEQARVLAELEADGQLHMSLVYRGTPETAALFIQVQEEIIEEIRLAEEEALEAEDGFDGDVFDEDIKDTEVYDEPPEGENSEELAGEGD